ncbi:MAG TPA: universal stress protein [Roseiflexaceae bacterium]|jgi:nucleotide-binding universal stress UspA family protein
MYHSILVPLDGSGLSEHAVPAAATIAHASGAALHLTHVRVPAAKQRANTASNTAESGTRDRDYLETIVERLAAEPDLKLTKTILDGEVVDALAAYAAASAIDLIVMTTYGHGGLPYHRVGSTTEALVRRISLPILLIQPNETAPDLGQPSTFQHVLVPLDGSHLAEQILEPALALGKLMHAEYTLLRIVEPLTLKDYDPVSAIAHLSERTNEEVRREAEEYLAAFAERLRADGVRCTIRAVIDRQPAAEILRAMHEPGIDLLGMTTHGRAGLGRLLIGSVAYNVVREAEIPVLIYRPQAP